MTTPSPIYNNFIGFFDFLKNEFSIEKKKFENNLSNENIVKFNLFLTTPFVLEKFLFFGLIACCDIFLSYFTIFPLSILFYLIQYIYQFIRQNHLISFSPELELLILQYGCTFLSVGLLCKIDIPSLYHIIKGQSFMKLYVIYNFLEVIDKLLCSIGYDVINYALQLFTQSTYGFLTDRIIGYLLITIYSYFHAIVLVFQIVSLNIALNAHNQLFFSLFISNQIIEIKGNVFKKLDRKNLIYMCNHDARERFIFIIMTLCLGISNAHFQQIKIILYDIFIVTISELVVDWVKHSFALKFNQLSQQTYTNYLEYLSISCIENISNNQSNNGEFLAKKLNFLPLPLFVTVIHIFKQSIYFKGTPFLYIIYFIIILFLLKIFTGILLLRLIMYWGKSKCHRITIYKSESSIDTGGVFC